MPPRIPRYDGPTEADLEARAIMGELRAEVSHGVNFTETLAELEPGERKVIRKVLWAAQRRRTSDDR